MRLRFKHVFWAVCMGLAAAKGFGEELPSLQHRSWRQYGGGADQSKYVEFSQITKSNVNELEIAWVYPARNGAGSMFNPVIVDNVMYLLGNNSSLVALDPTTGKELWIHANLSGIVRRGINYWESKDRKDRRLIFCIRDTLQAIDATTGKSILTFGENGVTSLKEGLDRDPATIGRVQSTTPGAIFEDMILLGSSPGENYFSAPGHLRAYNVITGKLVWVFHTVPLPGEFGYETWPKDAYKYIGGVNTWGEITVDEKRGIVYFPVGSPTYDYYGADRLGNGLFGNCLLALDARTGKRLWHYQMVHHDLWDYDPCAAPQLITVNHNGKKIDAVAQATKQGLMFVFDRVTGEPLWPIEERPVRVSRMPEEKSAPTQPVPTAPPPFNRLNVTTNDINPYFTQSQRESWIKRIAAARTGLFEPLSDEYETIAMPGVTGGANFGNTAADPKNGIVYVMAQEFPSVLKLKLEAAREITALSTNQMARAKAAYELSCQPCHGTERQGVATMPPLTNIAGRVNFEGFRTIVAAGKGQMPGFPHIDETTTSDLYAFLGGIPPDTNERRRARPGERDTGAPMIWATPASSNLVVASGGAFGTNQVGVRGPDFNRNRVRNYPEGVVGPTNRYSTGYGLEYPNLLSPPWSIIAAYDLNKGTLKWRRALGEDPAIVRQGGRDTGVPNGSQRKGMIVTSTGLVFASCKDGRIYAYDADNGDILWSVQLPRNPEGLLCMYEVNGRQFLEVCAMDFVIDKTKEPEVPAGYIVFALPEKSK